MPVISLMIPGGAWREMKFVMRHNADGSVGAAISYGSFIGAVVDFAIVGFVVFTITKALLKPKPGHAAPAMKSCPECLEIIPAAAKKCRACASVV